jgi:hypothetical protein
LRAAARNDAAARGSQRPMKLTRTALLLVVAGLALPGSASAASVALIAGEDELPTQIDYRAGAGEANKLDVTVAADGLSAEVSDPGAGTITPGGNCTAQNPKKVTCTVPAGEPRIVEVDAHLEDGNDTFDVAGAGSSANGGIGNDTLRGGAGRDFFNGGRGTDTLRGNGGDDQLYDGDVTGQSVNKDTMVGGLGNDFVAYSDRTAAVTVDLADAAGEGEAGEGDEVSEVENVSAGRSNDIVRGDGAVNVLQGGDGNDLVEGRDGNDYIGGSDGDDTLVPGPGRDDAEAGEGNDVLSLGNPPGQYDRLLTCGSGKDTIVGIAAAPSVSIECEVGDFGLGFQIGLKPKKVTTELVTVKIPCPDAFKRDGACKGSIVVEPTGAYNRDAAARKKQRYGAKSFRITKSTKVSIRLDAAGRKQLRKSAFKLQFTINVKETATGTKHRFEWTSYLVRRFL